MTLNKIRGWLYGSAKVLGDIQATQRALEEGSPKPVIKRLSRRLTGKLTARFLGWLHR
jgi:hypothetical protein